MFLQENAKNKGKRTLVSTLKLCVLMSTRTVCLCTYLTSVLIIALMSVLSSVPTIMVECINGSLPMGTTQSSGLDFRGQGG